MADKFTKVKGLPELIAAMKVMGSVKEIERIAYRGTFGAAKDLKTLVHANILVALEAPPDSGALARGIAQKKIKRGTRLGYSVGIRAGKMAKSFKSSKPKGFMGPVQPPSTPVGIDNPFYWRFLEFGTRHYLPGVGLGFFRKAIAVWQPKALRTVQAAGTKAVLASGNAAAKKFIKGG